jgi:hypothetical protein
MGRRGWHGEHDAPQTWDGARTSEDVLQDVLGHLRTTLDNFAPYTPESPAGEHFLRRERKGVAWDTKTSKTHYNKPG